MPDLEPLLERAHALVGRLEALLEGAASPDVPAGPVLEWKVRAGWRGLKPLPVAGAGRLADLLCVDRQKAVLDRNTRQFLAGAPANHALLWGPRGTGKSSMVRALLGTYQERGLRLVEVQQSHLGDLPEICALLAPARGRFLLFCDDLSFTAGDEGFHALKTMVDGSAVAMPENVLIYATSNRRHLVPEYAGENDAGRLLDGELHHGEAVEEKLALSERFGIWVAFHPFSQEQYLAIVRHWIQCLCPGGHGDADVLERAALQWALEHGSRSGRSAWQFARDFAGRRQVAE